jgi:hypothetical protein
VVIKLKDSSFLSSLLHSLENNLLLTKLEGAGTLRGYVKEKLGFSLGITTYDFFLKIFFQFW